MPNGVCTNESIAATIPLAASQGNSAESRAVALALLLISRSVPFSRRIFTVSVCPKKAASIRAVALLAFQVQLRSSVDQNPVRIGTPEDNRHHHPLPKPLR